MNLYVMDVISLLQVQLYYIIWVCKYIYYDGQYSKNKDVMYWDCIGQFRD